MAIILNHSILFHVKTTIASFICLLLFLKTSLMNRLLDLKQVFISSRQSSAEYQLLKNGSTIDRQQFLKMVYGENYGERFKAFDVIQSNVKDFEHFHLIDADREHQRMQSTKLMSILAKPVDLGVERAIEYPNLITLYTNGLIYYELGVMIKLGVHYALYMKTIQNLGTQKHRSFFQKAGRFENIGCFALTELSHGSDVSGMLTEAHYDHSKREIVLHTPAKQAMKFWIGGAAKTASMSVVWAQLYIGSKCYGIHAFITPLRSLQTHQVFSGITIGDCGPKNGLNTIDNGFLLFDRYRIPVANLLDRISGINEKGEFFNHVEKESKRFGLTLSALSSGRFFVSIHSLTMSMQALTISTRYVCERRQFSKKPGEKQKLLINYPLVKRRLLPLLSQEIIFMTAAMRTFFIFDMNSKHLMDPANPILQELHALSSILKAKNSWFAVEAIKESRQLLGGHGYSSYSKLGTLYNDHDVNRTWEGDNNVLIQQTTKAVLQNFQRILKGKKITFKILKFLEDPSDDQIKINKEFFMNPGNGIKFFQKNLNSKIQEMSSKMMELNEQKMPGVDIWNNCQTYLGNTLAQTTGNLSILTIALQKLEQLQDQNNKRVFTLLINLWLLKTYLEDENIDRFHHQTIENLIMEYCEALTPEVLGLLETLSADDKIIGSPFADDNGKGIHKYLDLVLQNNPTNKRVDWWEMIVNR